MKKLRKRAILKALQLRFKSFLNENGEKEQAISYKVYQNNSKIRGSVYVTNYSDESFIRQAYLCHSVQKNGIKYEDRMERLNKFLDSSKNIFTDSQEVN